MALVRGGFGEADRSAGRSEPWLSFACSAEARRRAWRKASWPSWTRSRRPRRKAAGTQAEEALALQRALSRSAGRSRGPGRKGDRRGRRHARLSGRDAVRRGTGPPGAGRRLERASPPPPRGRPRWTIEIAGYRDAGDDHFSARTADLEDIRDRVLGHLEPGADQRRHSRRFRGCGGRPADLALSRASTGRRAARSC